MKAAPCGEGLTRDCFKQNPTWAKRALATRLIHSLAPPQITRRLPKGLRLLLATQGAPLPPGIDPDSLPPGLTITPGTEIPPGWKPGDPLPPGTLAPPVLPPGAELTGPSPPTFLDPLTPGPVRPRPSPTGGPVTIIGTAFDGWVRNTGTDTWANIHDSAYGGRADTDDDDHSNAVCVYLSGGYYQLYRSFFYFDLSGLSSGSSLSSVTLKIAGYVNADAVVCAQEGTQNDILDTNDFDSFTGGEFGHVSWILYSSPDYNYNNIPFNSVGVSYIESALGGIAKICLREYNHDYLDVAPSDPTYLLSGASFADKVSEEYRPRLSLAY